jgi:hypothetical protein
MIVVMVVVPHSRVDGIERHVYIIVPYIVNIQVIFQIWNNITLSH